MSKNKRYRIIKIKDNTVFDTEYVRYHIQRRFKVLFSDVWVNNSLPLVDGRYSTTNLDEAKNMCDILNGDKKWFEKEIINY